MPHTMSTKGNNHLLKTLSDKDRQHFMASCTTVELVFADILIEPGEPITHVYFPTESYISLLTPATDDCAALAVGMVGNEGMLGNSVMLGMDVSPVRALVQGPGLALRMKAAPFRCELEQSATLQGAMKRYLYVMLSQIAQTAACTRFHVVEARLARWLLMTQDRAHSDTFYITHEFLAYMLGVRRVGVTQAASSLQKRKLIRYSRGEITILNRRNLEAASCGCYAAGVAAYTRILGGNEQNYQASLCRANSNPI